MATNEEPNTKWKTTIIMSSSPQDAAAKMLIAQQHLIRFSDSIEPGAFIFPLSGTAFLLVNPQEFSEHYEQSSQFAKIKKFVLIHRNCFVLLHAPFFGQREQSILSVLQQRFLHSSLKIIPVRNTAETVQGMLTIAKATSKPHVDSIRDRISLARSHIIEGSYVWKMLRDMFC